MYFNEYGGGIAIGSNTATSDIQGKINLYSTTSTESDIPSLIQGSIKDTTTGKTYSSPIISAYQDHGSTPYGFNLVIGSGGNTILGSGESPANLYGTTIKNSTAENLYLISDGHIYLYANANTVANRVGVMLHTNGSIYPQKAEADNNGVSLLGSTANRFKEAYFTGLIRVGPASTVTTSTTDGNSCIDSSGFWYDQVATGSSYGYTLRGKGKNYANLYVDIFGVADTPGRATLALGNATASTAEDSAYGKLMLYGYTTKYSSIESSADIKGHHLNYLPIYNATGTSTYYGRLVGIYKGTSGGSTSGFSNVGSTSQPVYVTANGVATAISYTIEKSVPSNAVFTDTNTKVNVTLATTTKAYLLGVSTAPTATAAALTAVSDTGVYLDTTAGKLTAASFAGNGAALTALNGSNISTGTVAFARLPTMYAGSVAIASSSSNTKVHNSGYLNLYANNGSAATRYIDIVGKNNAGTSVAEIFYDMGHTTNISSGIWYFRCKSPQSTANTTTTGYHDQYYLPGVTAGLTANRTYIIFTGTIGTSALTAGTSALKTNCFYAMYT